MAFGNYAPMGGYYQPPQQNFYVSANPNPVPDMLSQFKAPYQPQAMQANYNNLIMIHTEKEVDNYPVAPGNTVVLWDEKQPYFYMKSADSSGNVSKKIYEYKEYVEMPEKSVEHVCKCGDKFVEKKDFEALQEEIERLNKRIDAISKPKTKAVKHEEDDDYE